MNRCQRLARFSLLLALLLALSSGLYSDVVLTDEEASQIDAALAKAEADLSNQKIQIDKLTHSLTTAQSYLTQLQTKLTTAQRLLIRSQEVTQALEVAYDALEIYWQKRNAVTILIAVLSALVTGFIGYVIGAF